MSENIFPDMGAIKIDQHGRKYQHARLDNFASISCSLRAGSGSSWSIKTIHPYDLTEYHYAVSRDGEHWTIAR